jgi:hypothetical protein
VNDDGVVRYRRSARAPWTQALAVVLVNVAIRRRGDVVDMVLASLLMGAILGGATEWMRRRLVTELSPEAVTVLGFGRAVIPWERVQAVETFRSLGSRGVRLRLEGGRGVPLHAPEHTPLISPDPHFDEKVATIERYRAAATSAGSAP